MAGIAGSTGFVTVDAVAQCATQWSFNQEITNLDENRFESTTFCSSAREWVYEDAFPELETSVEYTLLEPVPVALLGTEADLQVGNASCSFDLSGGKCTSFSTTCPLEGLLESTATWEATVAVSGA